MHRMKIYSKIKILKIIAIWNRLNLEESCKIVQLLVQNKDDKVRIE